MGGLKMQGPLYIVHVILSWRYSTVFIADIHTNGAMLEAGF